MYYEQKTVIISSANTNLQDRIIEITSKYDCTIKKKVIEDKIHFHIGFKNLTDADYFSKEMINLGLNPQPPYDVDP